MDQDILSQLAPSGTLRAGINLSNFLLVTGKAVSGDPIGVAPDMARAIADRLGVAVSYVTFASPGELSDAAGRNVWDIGLIAAEPARAKTIAFTPSYVEIEATYMVPEGSSLAVVDDVDRPGIRIAVSGRSACDLYLTRHLKHAEGSTSTWIAASCACRTARQAPEPCGCRSPPGAFSMHWSEPAHGSFRPRKGTVREARSGCTGSGAGSVRRRTCAACAFTTCGTRLSCPFMELRSGIESRDRICKPVIELDHPCSPHENGIVIIEYLQARETSCKLELSEHNIVRIGWSISANPRLIAQDFSNRGKILFE